MTTVENCWVLARPDGTHIDNGDYVVHFADKTRAVQVIADDQSEDTLAPGCYRNATPRQLDHPCINVSCGCCGETFDESGEGYTVHFAPGEESLVTEAEWAVRKDGTYRCIECGPEGDCEDCQSEREAVASDA
ncbi:hypothetical protein FAF44_02845 [Nonomuraea sp. MG754425]|uniref:hypothetical protein n=1 Tax=Nonomuraea sp. MG754425 TaxID=2570319 RepID=UPI001F3153B0|nr:hypothetical protein [Nonomuraea sp. MG754425]MCF6467352.1 hypothetical protein [Nonomuraea sp. MG754425]